MRRTYNTGSSFINEAFIIPAKSDNATFDLRSVPGGTPEISSSVLMLVLKEKFPRFEVLRAV
jgi:hypothetical protein